MVVSQGIKWAMRVIEDGTASKGMEATTARLEEDGRPDKDRPSGQQTGVRAHDLDAGDRRTANDLTSPDTKHDRHVATSRSASAPSTHGRQRQSLLRLPGVSRRSTSAREDTTSLISAPCGTMTDTTISDAIAPDASASGVASEFVISRVEPLQSSQPPDPVPQMEAVASSVLIPVAEKAVTVQPNADFSATRDMVGPGLQTGLGDIGMLGKDLGEERSSAQSTAATVSHRAKRSAERQVSATVEGMVDSGDGVMCEYVHVAPFW